MMTATSPSLDAALKVYKVKGDITLRSGNSWTLLQRRAEIKPADMLRIPAGGSVEILDTDTRRIYSSVSTGEMQVSSLISTAINDASDITRKTNTRILTSLSENKASGKSRFGNTGLSMHDTDSETGALATLDLTTPYLQQLINLPADAAYDDYSDIILIRRDIDGERETFNFAVFNTLDIPLFINVIDQNPDSDDITFYFNENPLVNPRGETVIGHYRYLLPERPAGYIVIASDRQFTPDDIRSLLRGNTAPSGGDFFYSLLRI